MTAQAKQTDQLEYVALNHNVLVVAHVHAYGWTAYCAPVEGHNHDEEARGVIDWGGAIREEYARAMFPREPWKSLPYER